MPDAPLTAQTLAALGARDAPGPAPRGAPLPAQTGAERGARDASGPAPRDAPLPASLGAAGGSALHDPAGAPRGHGRRARGGAGPSRGCPPHEATPPGRPLVGGPDERLGAELTALLEGAAVQQAVPGRWARRDSGPPTEGAPVALAHTLRGPSGHAETAPAARLPLALCNRFATASTATEPTFQPPETAVEAAVDVSSRQPPPSAQPLRCGHPW